MPLKRKRKAQTLADGVADFYRELEGRKTPFGAVVAPRGVDDMDFIARLHFSLESKRERDFDFADQRGFTLAQKIKCHLVPCIDSSCRAVIDGARGPVRSAETRRRLPRASGGRGRARPRTAPRRPGRAARSPLPR